MYIDTLGGWLQFQYCRDAPAARRDCRHSPQAGAKAALRGPSLKPEGTADGKAVARLGGAERAASAQRRDHAHAALARLLGAVGRTGKVLRGDAQRAVERDLVRALPPRRSAGQNL